MALLKIKDFDPDYVDTFAGEDIKGQDVYTQGTAEKIGTVDDILVDENSGEFRYLLLNLGVGGIGKKVLLPIGRSQMKPNEHRVYASITKEQANNLPELEEEAPIDYDYEERVRGVYRQDASMYGATPSVPPQAIGAMGMTPMGLSGLAPMGTVESSALTDASPVAPSYSASTPEPINEPVVPSHSASTSAPISEPVASTSAPISQPYNRDTYSYQNEPNLYGMNDQDHQTLRLYEERIVANKRRVKTGEVTVGKHVETETARVSVPVEKERVIIERTTPADAGTVVSPGTANFREGEVARVEIYEETPDIHKEAFVREEVNVRKEVARDTVEAEETLRREELDIDAPGRTIEDRTGRQPNDRI